MAKILPFTARKSKSPRIVPPGIVPPGTGSMTAPTEARDPDCILEKLLRETLPNDLVQEAKKELDKLFEGEDKTCPQEIS